MEVASKLLPTGNAPRTNFDQQLARARGTHAVRRAAPAPRPCSAVVRSTARRGRRRPRRRPDAASPAPARAARANAARSGSAHARRPAPGCRCHHPWLRPGRVVVYDRVWGTSAIGPVDTAIAGRAPRLTAAWRSSRLDAAGRGGRRAGTDGRQSIHPPARPSEAVKFSGTGTCQLTVTFSDRLPGTRRRSGRASPAPARGQVLRHRNLPVGPSRFPGRQPRTAGWVGRHQRRQTRVDPRRRQPTPRRLPEGEAPSPLAGVHRPDWKTARLGTYALIDVDIDYEVITRRGSMPVSSTGTALGVGPATAADAVPARIRAVPALSSTLSRTYRGERRKTDRRERPEPGASSHSNSR